MTPLDITKRRAEAQVDALADAARQAWASPAPTQYPIYDRKYAEAKDYLAGLPEVDEPEDYPFVMAEVGITADTPLEVATIIKTMGDAWYAISVEIETIRLSAKKAIRNAASETEVMAALAITYPQP